MSKADIVREALERFPCLPLKTVARYVLYNYGDMFDGDLEKIRSIVRYQTGTKGKAMKKAIGDKVIKRDKLVMPQTWRKVRNAYKLDPGLWLILCDIHAPFHEPVALEAAIKYGQAQGATGILFNGDLQDCAAISYWPSSYKRNFDKEVEVVIDVLDLIDNEFPDAKKVFKPGNHEYRLPLMYQKMAPDLMGLPLLAFDTVLGLEYRGIEMLQFNQMVLAGKLPIFHGNEFPFVHVAVNAARGLFNRTNTWAMCGHCHSTSEHTERNVFGKYLTTWSVGCLCDLSPDYNPYAARWNWGTALVNVEKNGNFEVENRRILPSGKIV